DCARRKAADDARVVHLELLGAIVARDHGIRQRVLQARTRASSPLVEVAGVLMKNRRQNSAAKISANQHVSVSRAETFAVAFSALPIAAGCVGRLVDPRQKAYAGDSHGIDYRPERQLELLLRKQRRSVGTVGHVEVGNKTEDALLQLLVDLDLGRLH